MTYTNPINPKMKVTTNAYKRRRMAMSRNIKRYSNLDPNHIDYIEYRSTEYFNHVEHDISEFYLDLGYTEDQLMQMKKDMIEEFKARRLKSF